MNPFDLPGPSFLVLYLVVLAAAVLAALYLRWSLRGPGDEPPAEALVLDPYEIAFLAGGSDLALNAAFASLCQRGVLAPDASRRYLTVRTALGSGAHRVERAAVWHVQHAPGRTIPQLRATPPLEVTRLRERLEARELLLSAERLAAAYYQPALAVLAATLLGAIKIYIGVLRQRPVGILVFLCLLSMFAVLFFLAQFPPRTRRGERALHLLRKRNAALRASAGRGASALSGGDLAFAVGLFGLSVLYHGPLAPVAHALEPPGSSSGGSVSGDGGGCGGGGCGGGCGGCGGCGG